MNNLLNNEEIQGCEAVVDDMHIALFKSQKELDNGESMSGPLYWVIRNARAEALLAYTRALRDNLRNYNRGLATIAHTGYLDLRHIINTANEREIPYEETKDNSDSNPQEGTA